MPAPTPAGDAVLQTVALGPQWPTIDPFLFCAHHDDAYPAGDGSMAPAASLDGRQLGQDFAGIDGWNMYHGRTVPGFPAHPHRGFETVTYVRKGVIDHSDSLGAAARFGRGDVQWLTAGRGIQHAEMLPLLADDRPNPLELFQIWLNLPAERKLVDPSFTMLWGRDVPVARPAPGVEITVIAGTLVDPTGSITEAPTPPPDSYAAQTDADVAIWHIVLGPDAAWTMPAATGADTVRTLYVFEGDGLVVHTTGLGRDTGAVIDATRDLDLAAEASGAECLLLQGRPIGEPVARYGPFVMNTEAEIRQAFADYERDRFGGWTWDRDDPVHPADARRFARYPDGRVEEPER
jgi:redox-sensitive bicupin YhaK (pirin superfamily)